MLSHPLRVRSAAIHLRRVRTGRNGISSDRFDSIRFLRSAGLHCGRRRRNFLERMRHLHCRTTRCDCRGGEPDVLAARIAALGARASEPESESRLRRQGGGMIALRHSASSKNEKPACQRAFVKLCHLQKIWSGRRGSNPRPRPWQGRALPLSYTRVLRYLDIGGARAGNGQSYAKCRP